MENAKFIISLDFELHWGVFDTLEDSYNTNLQGTREAIKGMLELFKQYDIHATWATVGFLFNKNIEDYEKYKPSVLPTYKNSKLNSYLCKIGHDEDTDKLHYANEIIKIISTYQNQEIASHSYSHFYCQEDGQNIDQFEEDVKSAIKIAKDEFNIELKSYVFAKNEINDHYLPILKKHGFTHFRGNSQNWIYKNGQKTNICGRVIRFVDSFLNISGHNTSKANLENGLVNTKGNRFLRPYRKSILNKFQLQRIKSEMLFAAKHTQDYHLWWHPHNFGINTLENLENLEKILQYHTSLKKKYMLESVSMQEL